MNDEPLKPTPATVTTSVDSQTALIELRRAHESLRTLFQLVVLCGIVLSASVSFLVFKQVMLMKRQAASLQTMADEHATNWFPKLQFAKTNLEAFAEKNHALAPILQKYFGTNQPSSRRTPPPPASGAPRP